MISYLVEPAHVDQPLWFSRNGGLFYFELDTTGNVRRLHANSSGASGTVTSGDLGGYSYSAFGKTLAASEPGGVTPPTEASPFQWQGKRLIAPNLLGSLFGIASFRGGRWWSTTAPS